MRDSVTYQAIVEEGFEIGYKIGWLQGVRNVLLRRGRKKLGPPSMRVLAALHNITDEERLERLAERIDHVKSWKELLADE